MEEPLEIPITNDLTMVLGSISQVTNQNQNHLLLYVFVITLSMLISLNIAICVNWQSKALGVVVDFTEPSKVHDNVKQVKSHINSCKFLLLSFHA